MLYLTILFIPAILGAIIGFMDSWYIAERLALSLAGTFFGVMVGMISIPILMGAVHLVFDTEYVYKDSKEVYALQDNVGTEGRFFLGSGGVDSKMEYYYMIKEDKGMQIQSVNAEKSYVNEVDDVKPNINCYERRFENKVVQWLTPALPRNEYIFEIPEDSIKQNYNIDLQ